MSLKALRERMNDGNYATLAEAVRVLLDIEIERKIPAAGTAGHTVKAETVPVNVPKTNQGGGGDAAGTASPQVRTDSAAAASFEERVQRLVAEAMGSIGTLKAKLDIAEKECDKARLILGAYDSLDGGYGSRTWIQFHDARRAAEGK